MIDFLRKYPLLIALVALVIGLWGVQLPVNDTIPSVGAFCLRIVLFAIMIGIMILMGAKNPLASMKGFGFSICKSLYILILMLVLGVLITLSFLLMNGAPENIIRQELAYLLFCCSVGLFEESLFRGVILNALLRNMGDTRKGVVWAAILSSLIFGFVHVYTYFLGGSYDIIGIAQVILKTLQAASLGLLLAALYINNRNFWAIALVHALNDYFLMQAAIFSDTSSDVGIGSYVQSGSDGTQAVIAYTIFLLLSIPVIISAFKILKKAEIPEYGVFKK